MNNANGLYLSAAAMQVEQARLDLTAQNLANAGTPGYKRAEAAVQALAPTPLVRLEGALATNAIDIGVLGNAPIVGQVTARMEPGPLQGTGQPLDVAITGDGFFAVQAPEGLRYTRRGDFHQDATGRLVTAAGYPVLVDGSPAGRPGAAIEIGATGTIRVDGELVGTLDVVDLAGSGPPRQVGGGYWLPAAGDGQVLPPPIPPGRLQLQVGSLEQANVDPLHEMVNLMTAVRSYEANQKVLQAQDETLGRAADELART